MPRVSLVQMFLGPERATEYDNTSKTQLKDNQDVRPAPPRYGLARARC